MYKFFFIISFFNPNPYSERTIICINSRSPPSLNNFIDNALKGTSDVKWFYIAHNTMASASIHDIVISNVCRIPK